MINPETGIEGYYDPDGEFVPYPTLTYIKDPDNGSRILRGVDMTEQKFDSLCRKYDLLPITEAMVV